MATIKINRAPVLTLWATVVARHLGYDESAALTLGRALAGLNAQSKGRRLGLYKPVEPGKRRRAAEPAAQPLTIPLLGREIPAVETPQGIRAVASDQPINPESVRRYLESKFAEHLADVRRAMEEFASSLDRQVLAETAYALYEQFRPEVPRGARGWGAAGELSPERIRHLARTRGARRR